MERTISGMMGKGSINHNTRAFSAKNVDTERSIYNVEFCHAEIEEVYHELFDEVWNGIMRSRSEMTGRLIITTKKSVRASRKSYFMKQFFKLETRTI